MGLGAWSPAECGGDGPILDRSRWKLDRRDRGGIDAKASCFCSCSAELAVFLVSLCPDNGGVKSAPMSDFAPFVREASGEVEVGSDA